MQIFISKVAIIEYDSVRQQNKGQAGTVIFIVIGGRSGGVRSRDEGIKVKGAVFVFNDVYIKDYNLLVCKTSLQVKLKSLLINKKEIHIGIGKLKQVDQI